jgi:hypothetical protein
MSDVRDDDPSGRPSTADLAAARATPAPPVMTDGRTDASSDAIVDDGATIAIGDDDTDVSSVDVSRDTDESNGPLLGDEDLDGYRTRWHDIQVRFVDDPRVTVKDADALVAELMQHLAETFAEERASLESRWEGGADVSTEDLRVALQRYRSFFDRLLAA